MIGVRLITDGRLAKGGMFTVIRECDYWDKAEFVYPGDLGIPDLACNIEITGRVIRYDVKGLRNTPVIRVKVTFPGDGESDAATYGWVIARDLK